MKEKFLTLGPNSIFLDRYIMLIETMSSVSKFKHSEGHHIFPKFAFGQNDTIRFVSFRLHFILHELLWKHFKKIGLHTIANKAAYPLVRMCGKNKSFQNKTGVRFSSRIFEQMKLANISALTGENNPMYGRNHSAQAKLAISLARKGKPMSEQQKEKMRGRKVSDAAKQNMRNAKRPAVSSEECRARSARMKLVWEKRKNKL